MPKTEIDYSNTIIYKICCKNKDIKDIYVGHTTNFTKRKYQHKLASINNKSKCKIYETININGGWENWEMLEIAKYNCNNSTEARIKEQEHTELLNASLNMVPAFSLKEELYCESCNFKAYKKSDWERHIITNKHLKNITENNDGIFLEKNNTKNAHNNETFICECGKSYLTKSGIWKHKKTCTILISNKNEKPEARIDVYLLINKLIKENSELKIMLINHTNKLTDITMELAKSQQKQPQI